MLFSSAGFMDTCWKTLCYTNRGINSLIVHKEKQNGRKLSRFIIFPCFRRQKPFEFHLMHFVSNFHSFFSAPIPMGAQNFHDLCNLQCLASHSFSFYGHPFIFASQWLFPNRRFDAFLPVKVTELKKQWDDSQGMVHVGWLGHPIMERGGQRTQRHLLCCCWSLLWVPKCLSWSDWLYFIDRSLTRFEI